MGHVLLTLFCLWSCALVVTPISPDALVRATRAFASIFQNYESQYAYFVRFTPNECNAGLQEADLQKVLKEINSADVLKEMREEKIYEGNRMVAATPKIVTSPENRKITEHSEYRMLDPVNNSPISRLLDAKPSAGCVIFFSQNSPCTDYCTKINSKYNIISRLQQTAGLPKNNNNKAFVFNRLYYIEKSVTTVGDYWYKLDGVIPIYRCRNNNCITCYEKEVLDPWCYDSTLFY